MGWWISPKKYLRVAGKELASGGFWRDCLAEAWGSFLLMAVQCSVGLAWCEGDPGQGGTGTVAHAALGMCGVVAAAAGSMGEFGGMMLNPAITFAHIITLKITVTRGIIYICVECGAMIGAAEWIKWITPANCRGQLAATLLHQGVDVWQGVLTEMWITAMLVTAFFGATNKGHKALYVTPLIIAFAVAAGVTSAFQSTGASMNPSRSLGPAVAMGLWENHWVYWVGPLAGAAFASLLYAGILDPWDYPKPATTSLEDYPTSQEPEQVASKKTYQVEKDGLYTGLYEPEPHYGAYGGPAAQGLGDQGATTAF